MHIYFESLTVSRKFRDDILVYIQQSRLQGDDGTEFFVPFDITLTDGEKAWSGKCNPKGDSNFKGTSDSQFWSAVACAFQNKKPDDSSTKSLEWHFEPSQGILNVTWEMQYDEHIVLKNIFETVLTPAKDSQQTQVSNQ